MSIESIQIQSLSYYNLILKEWVFKHGLPRVAGSDGLLSDQNFRVFKGTHNLQFI